MTDFPEGTPCWADAMFKDVEGAKRFYGELFGWTFGEAASEYGNYTQAHSDGKAVAAVVPTMPGGDESPSAWCLYFASDDVHRTAEEIKNAGGALLMEPMQVGSFGSMVIAKEPSGAVFGVWQAAGHRGFEKTDEPGSYCWAELFTREPAKADDFLKKVFPYGAQKVECDDSPETQGMDFKVFSLGGGGQDGQDRPVLGRMKMGDEFPKDIPAYIQVYFSVPNCDAAVETAQRLGGRLYFGPMDSPFGRFAALSDPQGAAFAVLDASTKVGEMPRMTAA
ncbi:hydrolase [Streptomyces cinnamoneus]|uniref:Hydrolase n=1 Tax=Streptomyces cinnamoneus TaxID=53446 RepID=A0A2G1XK97_STRCJ|nr:VOC family protein [Streptomyces cinnamoneus]PHQ48915.1 hydrolase [Streptomyces cinnamoneus]PHQ51640.1 hydrolase [Streptomyces cinnamoneus]PPT14436.1 VOC family protein [Streptomyces cinnamoneus]